MSSPSRMGRTRWWILLQLALACASCGPDSAGDGAGASGECSVPEKAYHVAKQAKVLQWVSSFDARSIAEGDEPVIIKGKP